MSKGKLLILPLIIILNFFELEAQSFRSLLNQIKRNQLDSLDTLKNATELERQFIISQTNLLKYWEINSLKNEDLPKVLSERDSVLMLTLKGDFNLFKSNPNDSLAFDYYTLALENAIKISDTVLIAETSKKIMSQLLKSRNSLEAYPRYLSIYKKFLYDSNELATYLFHKFNYQGSALNKDSIDSLKIAARIAKTTGNNFIIGKISQQIGIHFHYFRKEIDSALFYYLKATKKLEEKPYKVFENELFGNYGNIGLIYQEKKEYNTAMTYFLKADSLKIPKYRYVEKVKINEVLSDNARFRKSWEEALYYLDMSNRYADTLNEYNKANKINEINIKYQTAEKEKQLLIEKQKKEQNRNLLFGSLGVIFFGGITFFLIQKNTRKKQRLAEQEKQLESQKLATALKEQELTAIDAMIEGQEKERQRIANDLHDDLGGLMATVKLHFNALKDKSTPELFDKTNNLIDEAYQKVRTVAHAKNSGVIAKQGLLKAVQHMADKISVANKIQIDVIDHGLDQRLENSLELTLFRVIQELVTNVLKHADASEVTIHLTNHEDSINIMVEDNGKGFNPSQITKSNTGMGISSIDKRIEHLDGKLTIESEINQGTTVIVDIPI